MSPAPVPSANPASAGECPLRARARARRRRSWSRAGAALLLVSVACAPPAEQDVAVAGVIHLEERLGAARVEVGEPAGSSVPPPRWELAGEDAGWRALPAILPGSRPVRTRVTPEALRVEVGVGCPEGDDALNCGGIFVPVDGWAPGSLSHVLIEARTQDVLEYVSVGFNVRTRPAGQAPDEQYATEHFASGTGVIADGAVHTYRLSAIPERAMAEPIRELAVEIGADGPAAIEILSVTAVHTDTLFADAGVGVREVDSAQPSPFGRRRRALFAHTPARIDFPVRVPEGGRLDLGLASQGGATRFSVAAAAGEVRRTLLEEEVPAGGAWLQRSLDLRPWSGRDATLTLSAEGAEGTASVALWSAPTITSSSAPRRPNVVFYVIDGASAGLMSVYGHNRRTTPNLERIAREGVVFEQAHSNSTWTTPSTASFMTSLHHSVLGGFRGEQNPVPEDATTMAQHFHRAGYLTGVFTTNPNAGSLSGLDREVDAFRDAGTLADSTSSVALHDEFWRWREAHPQAPYWVHFQTTDVHPPHHPPPPFAGLFVDRERRERFERQLASIASPWSHDSASVHEHYQEQLAEKGIDAAGFYGTMRDRHDEAMAHQDHQLGRLVERLKAAGEWERTLLVVASDHGHPAASYPRFGRGLVDPQPPAWEGALLGEHETHVPLIVVWPGRLPGGRRVPEPVSMIDVLPTLLELAELPPAEASQGRSLVPALRGDPDWRPAPVIFDEFRRREDGTLLGNLEVLDGRWGASLEIETGLPGAPPERGRHPAPAGGRWPAREFPDVPRLLLYDVWRDPLAHSSASPEREEEVQRFTRELLAQWEAHQALAQRFTAAGESPLTPEQLEALRSLGYIQ